MATTIWAANTAQGDMDGSSELDPLALADAVDLINTSGAPSEKTTVRILGDCNISSTLNITQTAGDGERIIWQGRDVADTQDQEVLIDAQGGAFPVWTLTDSGHHTWRHIRSTNTDQALDNSGWHFVDTNAHQCAWYRCTADNCYGGWNNGSARAIDPSWFLCLAHDNATVGIQSGLLNDDNDMGTMIECEAYNNVLAGMSGGSRIIRCLSYNNGFGFSNLPQVCVSCTSYNNGGGGYLCGTPFSAVVQDCISYQDDFGGLQMEDTHLVELVRFAWFSNKASAVRISNDNGILYDNDGILPLASDPFVDAANADFALNEDINGGAVCRNLTGHAPIGLPNTLSYHTIGAWQPPSFLGKPGMQDFQFNLSNWGVH